MIKLAEAPRATEDAYRHIGIGPLPSLPRLLLLLLLQPPLLQPPLLAPMSEEILAMPAVGTDVGADVGADVESDVELEVVLVLVLVLVLDEDASYAKGQAGTGSAMAMFVKSPPDAFTTAGTGWRGDLNRASDEYGEHGEDGGDADGDEEMPDR